MEERLHEIEEKLKEIHLKMKTITQLKNEFDFLLKVGLLLHFCFVCVSVLVKHYYN